MITLHFDIIYLMGFIDYLRIIRSDIQHSDKSINTLRTILKNILDNPNTEKYRELRLSNQTIHKYIVNVSGSIEFLIFLGQADQDVECEIPTRIP